MAPAVEQMHQSSRHQRGAQMRQYRAVCTRHYHASLCFGKVREERGGGRGTAGLQ